MKAPGDSQGAGAQAGSSASEHPEWEEPHKATGEENPPTHAAGKTELSRTSEQHTQHELESWYIERISEKAVLQFL